MRDDVDTIAPISAAGPAPGSKYDRLIARAKEARPAITMVAHPCDESSLRGAVEAAQLGIEALAIADRMVASGNVRLNYRRGDPRSF